MVLLRRAAAAAFLMFFLAAADCLAVINPPCDYRFILIAHKFDSTHDFAEPLTLLVSTNEGELDSTYAAAQGTGSASSFTPQAHAEAAGWQYSEDSK
jgi:hypothetical protein